MANGTSLKNNKIDNLDTLWHVRSESHRETRARAEHLRILFRHSTFVLLGNLAASLTLAVGLWNTVRHDVMVVWISAMIILNVARWIAGRRFPTGVLSDTETHRWERQIYHLTGVANRRAFEEILDREWYRAMRDTHTLSLIIADIDNFKLCNDNHGHAVGDQVLKAVAAMLEQRTRRGTDLVARIGGEEFGIILPDTDLDGALTLADSIKADIRKLANSQHNKIPEVTMSFGASSLVPDESLNVGMLFSAADAALYQAKENGKDRVETIDDH